MMTLFSPSSVLGRVPQTAALLALCLLCIPLALQGFYQQCHTSHLLPDVVCGSRRFPSLHPSLPGLLPTPFLSADAATTEGNVTLKPEVVLCLNGELFFAVALWAARHVNSTWPAIPAYPGNRPELGFRMDVPIRVKSIPFRHFFDKDRTVQWFAANGTDCDVFVGPGWSPGAVALSSLVNESQIWVDPFAMSNVLSNKTLHPTFSRIIPSWSQYTGEVVRFLNTALKVTHVIVVCDRYYRSVLESEFPRAWRRLNPGAPADALLETECFDSSVRNVTLWDRIIATITSSRIRTVFFPIRRSDKFLQRLNATRPDLLEERVFVFADTAPCGPLPFPGALCLSPTTQTYALPEYSYRSATSQAQDKAYYASLGFPMHILNSPHELTRVGGIQGSAYDAAVFALTALFKYRAAVSAGTVPLVNGTELTPAEYARLITVPHGLTGEVSLTSTGDRRHVRIYIQNSDTENLNRNMGYVESGSHYNTANLYLAGRMGVVPSALLPVAPTAPASKLSAVAIALMCVGSVLLVTITVGAVAYYFFRVGNVRTKPKPSAHEEEGVDGFSIARLDGENVLPPATKPNVF